MVEYQGTVSFEVKKKWINCVEQKNVSDVLDSAQSEGKSPNNLQRKRRRRREGKTREMFSSFSASSLRRDRSVFSSSCFLLRARKSVFETPSFKSMSM